MQKEEQLQRLREEISVLSPVATARVLGRSQANVYTWPRWALSVTA